MRDPCEPFGKVACDCDGMGCQACDGKGWRPEPEPEIRGDLEPLASTYQAWIGTMAANFARGAFEPEQQSPAEIALATALIDAGVTGYRQQHPVGPYFPDFYFPDARLVVEVDGDAYHTDREKDDRRTAHLYDHGVRKVLRLRALRVFTDAAGCVAEIKEELT